MERYIQPILKNNKCFILAYDHGFVHGGSDFNNKNCDINFIFDLALQGGFTGIVLHKGLAEYFRDSKYFNKVPLIVKLNSSTSLPINTQIDTAKLCSVIYAKKLGAVAVGYTIYLGSENENKMFEEFSDIQEQAHALNMGAIAWIYPKEKKNILETNQKNDFITQYATRIGLELGADMIKIKNNATKEGLKRAIELAKPVKVVLAGGEKIDDKQFLEITKQFIDIGGSGLIVGRNIWQRNNAVEFSKQIKQIILE